MSICLLVSHKTNYLDVFSEIQNLESHQNCCIGSKILRLIIFDFLSMVLLKMEKGNPTFMKKVKKLYKLSKGRNGIFINIFVSHNRPSKVRVPFKIN